MAANLVVTTNVFFGQADIVWVNDDWVGLADGTPVAIPPEHGGGVATIGSDAFDTMPEGAAAVKIGGTVRYRRQELLDWITAGCPRTDGGTDK